MSCFIEPLENRVLLSVTTAQLQADAKALVSASAASTAALNGMRSAEYAVIKAVVANLKHGSGLLGHAVSGGLTAALAGAGKTGYGHIKTSQKSLSSAAKLTAKQSLSSAKALIKKSTDTTLQSKVQDMITQLNTTLPGELASFQTVLQDAGSVIETALGAIVDALPEISSVIQAVSQAVLQKSEFFDTALAAIPTAAAQLAADLSSLTVQHAGTPTVAK